MTEKKPYSDPRWHSPFFETVGHTGEKLTPEQKQEEIKYVKYIQKVFKEKYGKDIDITARLEELEED